jgi:ketosteroid isomerase-like protein
MLSGMFTAIDAMDADRFATYLAPRCIFRFANQPAVHGTDGIRDYIERFFASIESIRHVIEDHWEVPGAVMCHGQVSYTRRDGSVLEVPFANLLRTGPEGITAYRIFVDVSELYA